MSEVRTIQKQPAQQSRAHDYLYDPLYSLSSERDHARTTFRANTNVTRIRKLPEFKTMFSSMAHYPNLQVRIDPTDPVPPFIPRQWRGYSEQAREALIRYTKFNYDPSVSIPMKRFPKANVSGRDRYKYFRRPIIPFIQQIPPDVVLERSDGMGGAEASTERSQTPATRNVLVQTDYRESEAQTDPYSPEYVVQPGSHTELLTIATLCYNHGLPAGLAEVEIIERARAKRAWEASLPALLNPEKIEQRLKMMEEQERKEWAFREQEIEKLQETKLKVLQKILEEREQKHCELNTKRLDKLWSKMQEEKEKKFEKIRSEHIKMIRKLGRQHESVEKKLNRRDILRDYADPGSQAYAPMSRNGVFLDKNSDKYQVKSRYLQTYQGLMELENSLPHFVLKPDIKPPKPKTAVKGKYVNRKQRRQHELEVIARELEDRKTEKPAKPSLRYLEKIVKPVPRPPTPSVHVPNEEEEKRELACILLQKVIRGRAVQNKMFLGKEQRCELINELRSTHALQEEQMKLKKQEKNNVLLKQRELNLKQQEEALVQEQLDKLEGQTLGDMLDFLSKELERFQEERRIHAFAMMAERERRMREAEESGRRQVEERRRREEDEIFKQVIGVHQQTVESYLAKIVQGAITSTAEEQARREVEEMAIQINDIAYKIEQSRTQLESEEIVAELVTSFLLPEVEKITMREAIKNKQRKNLLAAHRIIYNESEGAVQAIVSSEKSKRENNKEDKNKEDKNKEEE